MSDMQPHVPSTQPAAIESKIIRAAKSQCSWYMPDADLTAKYTQCAGDVGAVIKAADAACKAVGYSKSISSVCGYSKVKNLVRFVICQCNWRVIVRRNGGEFAQACQVGAG